MSRADREIPVCASDNRDSSVGSSDIDRDNVTGSRDQSNVSVDTRGNRGVPVSSKDNKDIAAVHAPRPTSKSKSDTILANATAVSYSNELLVTSLNKNGSNSTENIKKTNSTGKFIRLIANLQNSLSSVIITIWARTLLQRFDNLSRGYNIWLRLPHEASTRSLVAVNDSAIGTTSSF